MLALVGLIKISTSILGVAALFLPVLFVLRESKRPKGRASGRGAGSRTWLGVLLINLSFVAIGIVLWRPISQRLSNQLQFIFTLLGAGLYFPGVGLYFWGLLTLRSQFGVSGFLGAELYQEHTLITNGPFAIIRHPMYLGVICAAVGALLIFRTWAMVLFVPMSLVVMGRAGREEALLEAEFEDEWRVYASRVPKWIPKRRVGQ
jgi:protein-S-isoprenylcysteine O-methyltransferase Ste14